MKRTAFVKNIKRFFCLMLCLVMVLSLAGCGCGKKKTNSKNKTESTKDTTEEQDTTKSQDSSNESDNGTDAGNTDTAKKDSAVDTTIEGTTDGSTEESAGGSSEVVSANTMEVTSETKKSGEEFVITIQAGENTPVAAYTMELSYDTTKLQAVEYGRTEAFTKAYTGMCAENDKGGTIVFAGANMNTHQQYYTGDMLYVKFKAIGEAGSVSDVKLNVVEAVPYDGGNAAGEFTVKSGTVTIE